MSDESPKAPETEQLRSELQMQLEPVRKTVVQLAAFRQAQIIEELELADVENLFARLEEADTLVKQHAGVFGEAETNEITRLRNILKIWSLALDLITEFEFSDQQTAAVQQALAGLNQIRTQIQALPATEKRQFLSLNRALGSLFKEREALLREEQTAQSEYDFLTPRIKLNKIIETLKQKITDQDFDPTAEYSDDSHQKKENINVFHVLEEYVEAAQLEIADYKSSGLPQLQREDGKNLRLLQTALEKPVDTIRVSLLNKHPIVIATKDLSEVYKSDDVAAGGVLKDGSVAVDTEIANLQSQITQVEALNLPPVYKQYYDAVLKPMKNVLALLEEAKVNYEYNQWVSNLETNHKELKDLSNFLNNETSSPIGDDEDPQSKIDQLQKLLTAAREAIKDLYKEKKQIDYLNDNYWGKAAKFLGILNRKKKEYGSKKTTETISEWEAAVQPLEAAIKEIMNLDEDNPYAQEVFVWKERLISLHKLQNDLVQVNDVALQAGLLSAPSVGPGSGEISSAIRSIKDRHRIAEKLIKTRIEPRVALMTHQQLIVEILNRDLDFEIKKWTEANYTDPRAKALLLRFRDEIHGGNVANLEQAEYLSLTEMKVAWQLQRIYSVLTPGQKPAAADIRKHDLEQESNLEQQLNAVGLLRREFLAATTMNPFYGKFLKEILIFCKDVPALESGEKLVIRNGRRKLLLKGAPVESGDTFLYEGDSRLSYNALAGDQGRSDILPLLVEKAINYVITRENDPLTLDEQYLPWVKMFAADIFVDFDFLSSILAELQKRTKTRSHNGGRDKINRSAMYNFWGDGMHGSERYGGCKAYFGTWPSIYGDEFPDGYWGAGGVATEWNHARELAILYKQCFYDTDGIVGAIKTDTFNEAMFTDGFGICTPHENDIVRIGEYAYDADGEIVGGYDNQGHLLSGKGENFLNFPNYFVSEVGWHLFLEIMYKGLPSKLSWEQIIEEYEPGKGRGLLGLVLGSYLGRAKMSRGRHMEEIMKPMLLDFIKDVFHRYEGITATDRTALFYEVKNVLEHTKTVGGLSWPELSRHIDEIIKALEGDKQYLGIMSADLLPWEYRQDFRWKQKVKYVTALWRDKYPEDRFPDLKPPWHIRGRKLQIFRQLLPHEQRLINMLRSDQIEEPITRSGNLMQEPETKS